jgi:eukaryotic-like serine/threonine-protein kinase
MDTERNLLFGVVAFQNGAVDADRLAETCAAWVEEPSQTLANLFVDRGLMTDEQRTELEKVVEHELDAHGGDPQATLAATMDARSLVAIRDAAGVSKALKAQFNLSPQAQNGHVVLGTLSPGEESRERYTLTHLHAKGGMGRVWLARDGALGRQIALKELRPDQTDNSIVCSRFLYEAKITAQLEHPGIVPVYELGEGDVPYYTMRFVRGRTLNEAIRAYHKKRAAGEADSVGKVELLTAFVNVCHAVAYAHSRGIIHRDLKGQNVVLGDFGEVMVLDWGLAKRVGPDRQMGSSMPEAAIADPAPGPSILPALDVDPYSAATCDTGANPDDGVTLPESHDIRSGSGALSNGTAKSYSNSSSNGSGSQLSGRQANRESGAGPEGTMQGQLLGTPAYMAPEQAQGRHDLVNERTDVYGLGAILYEILTGRPPFIAPKTSEIIRKVCQEAPTPPRQILATIPPGLEGVCMKALRKASSERYVTAAELAQEVQRYLADEPVQAYAEPWTTRVLRWARRHKTMVSAAAALLVTATTALAVSTVLISKEKTEAETQGQQARNAVHMLTKVADIGFDDQLDPLQKEFLEEALQYYEQFTSRVAHDPGVRLEHGRVYQQMGDIQRKLGRLPESKQAYLKAIDILQPLAEYKGADREPKQALARSRTLLADLSLRDGGDKEQAGTLLEQALASQRFLADSQKNPAMTTEDILRLGQTLKCQADLLKLNGKFSDAKRVFTEAINELDRANDVDSKKAEVRNELASAMQDRGFINRELGDLAVAEIDYRRAIDIVEKLVAEFPTAPRHREVLAKAYNNLGWLEQETSRLNDAEAHLRRVVTLTSRLAEDFPEWLEYRRLLARGLNAFGDVLQLQGNIAEAEPVLRRSIEVNAAVAAQSPDDVLVRFQLGVSHHDLGLVLMKQGNPGGALASFHAAKEINEAMTKEFPGKPRYLSNLADNYDSIALALSAEEQSGVDDAFQSATKLYEKLVTTYPESVQYRIRQATSLQNRGAVLAKAGHPEQSVPTYRNALALLDSKAIKVQTVDLLRKKAELLNNLGGKEQAGGDEDTLRKSIAISEQLAAKESSSAGKDHSNLAIAEYNLADFLVSRSRSPEAGEFFNRSVANFEKLVAAAPKVAEVQHHFGIVLAGQGKWLDQLGKTAEAKSALASAVDHQRQAVTLSKNAPVCRLTLADHLVDLADLNRKLGGYEEAAQLALEVPKTVPSANRAQACFDAARTLARLVTQVGTDAKLPEKERDYLTRSCLTRTVVLLRDAIDGNSKLSEQIRVDPDIKVLESRPEFQTLLRTLVDSGRSK